MIIMLIILETLHNILFVQQYASEDAELLLVGNKLDCESDRVIARQQAERVSVSHCFFFFF